MYDSAGGRGRGQVGLDEQWQWQWQWQLQCGVIVSGWVGVGVGELVGPVNGCYG